MKSTHKKQYLLNYVFLFSLLILVFNDHHLKYEFSNWFTGKLSDAAGIIILPLLIAFLFPKVDRHAIFITAIIFTFWKSPLSQTFLDFYNTYSPIPTSRIIDVTDLSALILLPIPYYIIANIDNLKFLVVNRIKPIWVLMPTVLALAATAPPQDYYYTKTDGNLSCDKCVITVDYSQSEIIEKLKRFKIVFDSIAPMDSAAIERVPNLKYENAHTYKINQLIIEQDTLNRLDFTVSFPYFSAGVI